MHSLSFPPFLPSAFSIPSLPNFVYFLPTGSAYCVYMTISWSWVDHPSPNSHQLLWLLDRWTGSHEPLPFYDNADRSCLLQVFSRMQ